MINNNMNKVVIYAGRFQPMLAHHAQVYRTLQAQFPGAEVYVGTSNKVDGVRSPFNFAEKQLIASAHGIPADRVLLAHRPYSKDEYDFDQHNTVIIFAVGEKDADRFPFNNVDTKTGLDITVRGERRPKYYQPISTMKQQLLPMSERGYVTLVRNVISGNTVVSASDFRQSFVQSADKLAARQVYTKYFGEYNHRVFEFIYNKLIGTNMNEQLITLRKLAGLPLMEGAPVDFSGDIKSSLSKEEQTLAEIGRLLMDIAVDVSDAAASAAVSKFGMKLTAGDIMDYDDLIAAVEESGTHAQAVADAVKDAIQRLQSGDTVRVTDRTNEDVHDEQSDQMQETKGIQFGDTVETIKGGQMQGVVVSFNQKSGITKVVFRAADGKQYQTIPENLVIIKKHVVNKTESIAEMQRLAGL